MSKIQPLADRVVIRPMSQEKTTASGIVIPDTHKEDKPMEGEVIAVGPGRTEDGKLIPVGVKKGQKVLFSKYAPTEVKVDGEELLIMDEKDILAVIG
ncbi:MAG: co-chaperone GroES [Candidatus Gracilibacteria bacterium]|nr:co-chaperone GroES [Candidatus Gracilibacteria bacterium]